LGQALLEKARYNDAIDELVTANRLSKDATLEAELANAYAVAGRKDEARSLLRELSDPGTGVRASAYAHALVYAGLDDKDEAFRWLTRAAEQRESGMANINVHPRFASLRSDPRFATLQQQLGLLKH
jgi:tetratricopeptide (TPR) repeat protein